MPESARARLAVQQAELIETLQAVSPGSQPRFDAARLDATRASLARKRARAVARAWPDLARELGRGFDSVFAGFTATNPQVERPLDDGRAFAKWLGARLPRGARLERLANDLQAGRRLGLERTTTRWVVGFRLPWFGVGYLSFP